MKGKGNDMFLEISEFYTKRLNELNGLERNADASDMELFTDACRITHGVNYPYSVYRRGDKFYIKTESGVFEMVLRNRHKVDNEVNLHKETLRFEFTPDNKHIWSVELFKNDLYDWNISGIEADHLPASDKYIQSGDTASYKGVTLTFNAEDSVTIGKDGKTFTMTVKEDNEKVYQFLKRTIRARHGAYGLFSFMENIAEQAKINKTPFWSDAYMIMERFVA